jgi:hypothetical protein
MTMEAATVERTDSWGDSGGAELEPAHLANRHRFTVSVVIALAAVSLPYLWISWDLWSSSVNPFRQLATSNFYDLQARAMFAGHLYVPNGSLGVEAFVHNGRQYTYFGLFPSILRMPVLALTHSFDGRLTAPSMLLAWVVTGVFVSSLLWRIRVMVRGSSVLGRAETVCCGVLVAGITGGSALMYLAASPRVYQEDLAWSAALTIASTFALLGVLERPSRGRVWASGVLILMAALDRGPTGYACVLGAFLVAGWFALGRGGMENRRWALPVFVAGLVPLIAEVASNVAKVGSPLSLVEADQVWTQLNAHRRLYLAANGGSAFGLKFLPSTLYAYMQPAGIHLGSTFPFISLPTSPASAVGKVILDETYPTASIPASMPLLFLLGCWGVITAFRPRPISGVRVTRLLLVATAAGTAGALLIGYISERYLADFLPFLALAGMIGMIDLWRRLEGRGQRPRVIAVGVVVALGVFGVWANVGAAITPTALWTPVQAKQFVSTQESLGGTGTVVQGPTLPYFAAAGTLYAVNQCSGLYLSTGFSYQTIPGQQLQHETWVPVEQGPGIKHALTVTFNRTMNRSDAPVALLTYGKSILVAVPTGADHFRLQVDNPGAPGVTWPPAATNSFEVKEGTPYRITVVTDPNLQSIEVEGLGDGIEHYLAGKGPALVHATGDAAGTSPPPVSVVDSTKGEPSMALCKSLVRHSPK